MSLAKFLRECTLTAVNGRCSSIAAYTLFCEWQVFHRRRVPQPQTFAQAMLRRGFRLVREENGREVFLGLCILPEFRTYRASGG